MTRRRGPSRPVARIMLLTAGLIVPLILVEGALRLAIPPDSLAVGEELEHFRENLQGIRGALQPDAELGYAPILGGRVYNEWGAHRNHYRVLKGPGVTRLMFIGDSVTARARVMRSLSQLLAGEQFEYWNAGVEGWNTEQEVGFFFRVNHEAKPDRVILGFHNNDFRNTPIGYLDDDGRLVVYQMRERLQILPGLYGSSYLYRLWIRWRTEDDGKVDYARVAPRVEASLRRLRDGLRAMDVPLTILLYPIFAAPETWEPEEQLSRRLAIEMLQRLGVHWIDLIEPVTALVQAGTPVSESPTDRWHPNETSAMQIAAHALSEGLLGYDWAPPTLIADRPTITTNGDDVQTLLIDCGSEMAHAPYAVLGSCSGTIPGVRVGEHVIPLNPDAYTIATITDGSGVLAGGTGRLDDRGRGRATVAPTSAHRRGLRGARCHHVCVVLDESRTLVRRVTGAVVLEVRD